LDFHMPVIGSLSPLPIVGKEAHAVAGDLDTCLVICSDCLDWEVVPSTFCIPPFEEYPSSVPIGVGSNPHPMGWIV
ncbi:MAG: hypothetical protein AAFR59_10670, partial [Bacteroidota bacterium]